MKRTFPGWLKRYCQHLTGVQTTSVKKLVCAAQDNAPHAREAIGLYAITLNRADDLLKHAEDNELKAEWESLIALVGKASADSKASIRLAYDILPVRYRKVIDLYDSIDADKENDSRVKELMAQRTLAALKRTGATRYRLCHDLNLNEGNVYAWLAGDPTKVSRETARRVWKYAESMPT